MIRVIRSELRKNGRRLALRLASGLIVALVVFAYGISLYGAVNSPGSGPSILTLYPDQFVNNAMGGAGLTSAIAMIVGALMAASDYSWGTLKTALTQRADRMTTVAGRIAVFLIFSGALTLIIFLVSAGSSVGVALYEGHTIEWPPAIDLAKGFGAIWLVVAEGGALGVALGYLFRSSAVAVGVGLIYALALQLVAVRFVASLAGGAYRWLADLFDGQNSTALLESFTSSAFGRPQPPAIGSSRAVLVLCTYLAAFILISATLVRQRDVT